MTVKQYAFYFDSASCSGCKACQVACKDNNGLEVGILWRRVYEISGGGWQQREGAWVSSAFAYHLSIACNHCEQPICREVCPAGAIRKRPDGIVLIDSDKCLGCHYCSWACPYGAPQYDEAAGHMTKCDFCYDEIDWGGKPSCVAACPMRALDFGDKQELEAKYGLGVTVYPLPQESLTRPSLVIHPHPQATQAISTTARLANREEVRQP